ncbi:hypothetical protein V8F20_004398 [Naviculisporaceae sp. PSN 640]
MLSFLVYLFALLASHVAAQGITLTPSTVTRGVPVRTITVTQIVRETVTTTASYIRQETVTSTATVVRSTTLPAQTVTRTATSVSTLRTTVTLLSVSTKTQACGPAVQCPTITQTATACRQCLIPQCTTTETLNKPCGCAALPTQMVSFPCGGDSCNQIGCTTVYAIKTAAC